MNLLLPILSLIFFAIANASDVVVASDDDMEALITDNQYVLMEFYAPWCGHCKSLAPEYEQAAESLQEEDVIIAKCDATENKESAQKYGVQGFPTLKWFVNGKPKEYTGGRTSSTIIDWVMKKMGPVLKPLADQESVDAFIETKPVVVGYFSDPIDTEGEMYMAYKEACEEADDFKCGVTSVLGDAKNEDLVVYFSHGEGSEKFTGEEEAHLILNWANAATFPPVVKFSQASAPRIFGSDIKLHALVFADDGADILTAAEEAAQMEGIKGTALFVQIDSKQFKVMEFFDVKAEDLPTVRLTEMTADQMAKYSIEGEPTAANMADHVKQVVAGTLAKLTKSAPIPEDNDGPVTVLVGDNFEEIALNKDKDVLVEFYAPWCGHCKRLAPIYEKLGEAFQAVDSVVIANFDATANDVEAVSVKGFPTLKFFPAGTDEIVDFTGGRTLNDMIDFVNENGKSGFEPVEAEDDDDDDDDDEL